MEAVGRYLGGDLVIDATLNRQERVGRAGVGVEQTAQLGYEIDRRGTEPDEWTTSRYVQGTVSGDVGVDDFVGEMGVHGRADIVAKEIRNLNTRELVAVEVVASVAGDFAGHVGLSTPERVALAAAGSNGSVVRTVRVPLDNDDDRAIAKRWSDGIDGLTGFIDLARRKGKNSMTSYSGDTFGLGAGAELSLGPVRAGAGGRGERKTVHATDGYFQGAPDASGNRSWVPHGDCVRS